MIRASAPSELILFGEHALAYGEPAIATATNKRIYVTACELEEPRIVIEFKNSDDTTEAKLKDKTNNPIVKTVQGVIKNMEKKTGIGIEVDSGTAPDSGIVSSSAIASASAAAVMGLLTEDMVAAEIAEISYEAEKSLYQDTNGIDSIVTAFGGTIMFQRGKANSVAINNRLGFVVGDTGIERSRAELLEKVKAQVEDPKVAHTVFSIGSLVRRANETLESYNPHEVGKLMDDNHMFLRNLGVSSAAIENLVEAAKGADAFGAKLTGAGGGGCVIALAENLEAVIKAMKDAGAVRAFKVETNQEGVKIEN